MRPSSLPDAFELVAPRIDETELRDDVPETETAIFDQDKTYRLYQCLHELFQPIEEINE